MIRLNGVPITEIQTKWKLEYRAQGRLHPMAGSQLGPRRARLRAEYLRQYRQFIFGEFDGPSVPGMELIESVM